MRDKEGEQEFRVEFFYCVDTAEIMGESACLMHAFSYTSGISHEAKEVSLDDNPRKPISCIFLSRLLMIWW